MFLISPFHVNFICSKSLRTSTVLQRSTESCLKCQQTSMSDHDAIVDTEAFVSRIHASTPFLGHLSHHLLQALVTAYAADDEYLITAHVRHGALGDLHEHGENGLLQTETQVLGREPIFLLDLLAPRDLGLLLLHLGGEQVGGGEDAAEAAVHALDGVRQVEEPPAVGPPGEQLDVVAGGRVVADGEGAGEAVEAVADGDVEGLAEDAVPPLGVRDHLRVAPAHVQHDRVPGPRDRAPHLDVAHAVVHADERQVTPEQRERTRRHRDGLQGRAHPRALGVAYARQLRRRVRDAGGGEGGGGQAREVRAVVPRRVLGQEAGARRRVEGVPQVGQDRRLARRRVVRDDADAELVGAALAAEGEEGAG